MKSMFLLHCIATWMSKITVLNSIIPCLKFSSPDYKFLECTGSDEPQKSNGLFYHVAWWDILLPFIVVANDTDRWHHGIVPSIATHNNDPISKVFFLNSKLYENKKHIYRYVYFFHDRKTCSYLICSSDGFTNPELFVIVFLGIFLLFHYK